MITLLMMTFTAPVVAAATAPVVAAAGNPGYVYTFTPPSTAGSPRITLVQLNSDKLRAGGPIDIKVTTSRDVVKVTTGKGKQQGTLMRSGPGLFTSQSTLPNTGSPLVIHIKLHFTATTAGGKTVSVDVPVSFH